MSMQPARAGRYRGARDGARAEGRRHVIPVRVDLARKRGRPRVGMRARSELREVVARQVRAQWLHADEVVEDPILLVVVAGGPQQRDAERNGGDAEVQARSDREHGIGDDLCEERGLEERVVRNRVESRELGQRTAVAVHLADWQENELRFGNQHAQPPQRVG